ncbi:HNH endonuclease [Streptomyces sp. NPDC001584]|uniref:HNH endonuclease n=1 Tax=Streptomyces sp. NPDC001584 TaxID=3154521 RepID=UPI003321E15A
MPRRIDDRPKNPDYLLRAVRRIFGTACLRCGTSRPHAEMAHIRDWPMVRKEGHEPFKGLLASIVGTQRTSGAGQPTKRPDLAKLAYEHTYGLFHDLGNVLPLCPNCHTLFDGKSYPEVTEADILAARDDAVRRPEVLAKVIDFIRDELRGRPRRCTHRDEHGRQKHTHRSDIMALGAPLSWVARGFAAGLDLGNRTLVVDCISGLQHHRVDLAQGALTLCVGPIEACPDAACHTVTEAGAC